MQLQQQIDLSIIPAELQSASKSHPTLAQLHARIRNMLGIDAPEEDDEEKQFERVAVRAADEAMQEGNIERAEQILAQYAKQAEERAKAKGKKSAVAQDWQGDSMLLQQTVSAGFVRANIGV